MPDNLQPEWLKTLVKAPLTSRLRRKESLKRFNTWRIGGVAECLIDVRNIADLSFLLPFFFPSHVGTSKHRPDNLKKMCKKEYCKFVSKDFLKHQFYTQHFEASQIYYLM